MKKLEVYGYRDMDGQLRESDGNRFTYKPVISADEAAQCRIGFVEVEPGNYAFGYHYHEMDEEAFYVISGEGIVRTINGDVRVKAGEIITFPPGEKGAHVMRNESKTETLVFLDFDTNNTPEIVHFPDMKKIMVKGPFSSGMYDEPAK